MADFIAMPVAMVVHSTIRRIVVPLVFAVLLVFGDLPGDADATWGATRPAPAPRRVARTVTADVLVTARRSDARAESAVVLVVLDGVRWQEVFYGTDRSRAPVAIAGGKARDLMPNLYRLIEASGLVLGAPGRGPAITATGPDFISLPGYMEIFAGKADPTCDNNDCPIAAGRTIVDDVRDSSGPADVALVTSWPNIARAASADPLGLVMTAGRDLIERADILREDSETAHLLDLGARASASPGEDDYRPDTFTARIALRHLEVARPRFMFVGLGDADEYAHKDDYRGYIDALRRSDAFLGDLASRLARMGARGRHTTVIVTADHGRAYDFKDHGPEFPESGRVWLAAFGGDLRGRGIVRAQRSHTLSDVAPTVRALLGMAQGEGTMAQGKGTPIAEIVGDRASARQSLASAALSTQPTSVSPR